MASKIMYWIVASLSAAGLLTGISRLAEGIQLRGFGGVNYGGVLFPALLAGWAVYQLQLMKRQEKA